MDAMECIHSIDRETKMNVSEWKKEEGGRIDREGKSQITHGQSYRILYRVKVN